MRKNWPFNIPPLTASMPGSNAPVIRTSRSETSGGARPLADWGQVWRDGRAAEVKASATASPPKDIEQMPDGENNQHQGDIHVEEDEHEENSNPPNPPISESYTHARATQDVGELLRSTSQIFEAEARKKQAAREADQEVDLVKNRGGEESFYYLASERSDGGEDGDEDSYLASLPLSDTEEDDESDESEDEEGKYQYLNSLPPFSDSEDQDEDDENSSDEEADANPQTKSKVDANPPSGREPNQDNEWVLVQEEDAEEEWVMLEGADVEDDWDMVPEAEVRIGIRKDGRGKTLNQQMREWYEKRRGTTNAGDGKGGK